ncbi:Fumitremorgin C synthase [Rhizoctonia solani]|uniref:Fumitremorgin C synthase n=1 Tax=Rhizoctonia solani TaxID=456999 RepID=A0A0K6G2W4_9AGAM|nr:Fumitremorgin C synthase [Rhizoctonia solani]
MSSTMFQLAYGYELQGPEDPFFVQTRELTHIAVVAAMYSNFFVNVFPALVYLPAWLPGMGWKKTALKYRAFKEYALRKPYEWTKSQVASGKARPSILGSFLKGHQLTSSMSQKEMDDKLEEVGFIIYAGGTDTSSNSLVSFVAAMVMNPHVQQKAQHEIDSVLGTGALPEISDKERLPYINCLIKELLRWYPALPIALPHVCYADDVYRGYEIKKGTTMIGNVWAITRDEREYKDPEVFNPDRYMDPSVPMAPVFGWGRRKCPGLHFAEDSLFLAITSLLATFTFSKRKGPNGEEITPKIEPGPNVVTLSPKEFEFDFKPRSDEHRQLILEITD